MKKKSKDIDKRGWPIREGIYLAIGVYTDQEPREIDVYRYRPKGLCCLADDFGNSGTGVDDEHDCHVSVQMTGLEFIRRVRGLGKE